MTANKDNNTSTQIMTDIKACSADASADNEAGGKLRVPDAVEEMNTGSSGKKKLYSATQVMSDDSFHRDSVKDGDGSDFLSSSSRGAESDAVNRDEIIDSLLTRNGRRHLSSLSSMKLLIWDLTVQGTKVIKRIFDLVITLFALLLLSPVFIIVALLIKLEDGGKIIYRQIRVGKDGKHFNFYKFRSMVENADKIKTELLSQNESKDGVIFKMKHDPRITRIGRFIRRFSIDELPQLFNVLSGDMSLVGPRPPLPSEVAQYTLEDRKRLHVLPGITCLWQIQGRSEISFKDQVILDKNYIHSQSIWRDFIILLKTIPAVFIGKGAY